MFSPRHRLVWIAVVALVCGWVLALTGYAIAKHSRVTAEKVSVYLNTHDLARLQNDQRKRALRELADKMNALTIDERRRARVNGAWEKWFAAMSDPEKVEFIEATLPSGFKQMLNSFEELPEAKRRLAVEQAVAEMKKARQSWEAEGRPREPESGFNDLNPDARQKVVQLGLKTYYSQSSAQTKAELAPLLEEMQRMMESGALFRRGRPD
jgi:hypothetical protein